MNYLSLFSGIPVGGLDLDLGRLIREHAESALAGGAR